jgi:hypothetical protein
MSRSTAAFVLVAIAFVAMTSSPAHAAVTAQLKVIPQLLGPCPATVKFTGTISGPAGTSFQYSFNRFINGVQQIQNAGAASIPQSGNLSVNDSVTLNISTGATTFDQIWIHNLVGQPDIYSNKAYFVNTCKAQRLHPFVLPSGVIK